MERRERQLAQIARDFMRAFCLADEIVDLLSRDELGFETVQRLVGEAEDSALHRLKEECHALFRYEMASGAVSASRTAATDEVVSAEELFDLAVGALFHESMKFREGFYLTTTYKARLEGMVQGGSVPPPLAAVFERMFTAGERRMRESAAETQELFRETRDQLRILLRQLEDRGSVARSLVEDPQRTEHVFGSALPALLEELYGSAERGYRHAIDSLLRNGHFPEALEVCARDDVRALSPCDSDGAYASGMAAWYGGDASTAIDHLARWVEGGASGDDERRRMAARALAAMAQLAEDLPSDRAELAHALVEKLVPPERGG